jgi:hypothetical protein
MRATCTRTEGMRHVFTAYELGEDKLLGHVKPRKTRARFLEFCRYLRTLYPPSTRIAIICDNFSPHLSTARDGRVGARPAAPGQSAAPGLVTSCRSQRRCSSGRDDDACVTAGQTAIVLWTLPLRMPLTGRTLNGLAFELRV